MLLLAGLAAVSLVSARLSRSPEQCLVDGAAPGPVSRVRLQGPEGGLIFCSPCCARRYLDEHPALAEELRAGRQHLLLVNAIRGEDMDGSLAYFIESELPATRHNRCNVHIFGEAGEAAAHLVKYRGRELPGYLAGQGRRLDWADPFCAEVNGGGERCLHALRGNVIFLRFWSLANPFAHEDLAALDQAQREFVGRGFTVLAVNVGDPTEDVRRTAAELSLSFPLLLDPDGRMADSYGVSGFPSGFLIDRAGIIGRRIAGEVPPELMRPLLREIL